MLTLTDVTLGQAASRVVDKLLEFAENEQPGTQLDLMIAVRRLHEAVRVWEHDFAKEPMT